MKNKFIIVYFILLFSKISLAQTPDDALRNAWFIPGGNTARSLAIGGAMGSLGGDISAINTNPAGLGFYKTSEVVISPGFIFNNSTSDYRGSNNSGITKNAFALGTSGFVIGGNQQYDGKSYNTFGVTFSQIASFNNRVYYNGDNNLTSYSEQYLEELTRDGADISATSNNYIFGSTLAYFTYLIDSVNDASGNLIGYRSLANPSTGLSQEYNSITSGGIYELALGYANNTNNKLYFGTSLGIPLSLYKNELNYTETDISGNDNNDFGYSKFHQTITSNGIGLNFKLGAIYKPDEYFRLGFAIHIPSFFSYASDKIRADMTTNTEAYAGTVSQTSDDLNGGNPGTNTYTQSSPWRAIFSGSFVFRESSDARLQRGFLTVDVEYVNYQSTRYYANQDVNGNADPLQKQYFDALKQATKDYLKSTFNFRLGAEIKFSPWMVRGGVAYYGSPYEDNFLKANKMMVAGGFGYRDKGIFIDLTYAYSINKDVSFPYRLNDAPNTFANIKNNRGNGLLTVGFKL